MDRPFVLSLCETECTFHTTISVDFLDTKTHKFWWNKTIFFYVCVCCPCNMSPFFVTEAGQALFGPEALMFETL